MWLEGWRQEPGRTTGGHCGTTAAANGQSNCQTLNSSESHFGFPQTGREVAEISFLSLLH